MCTEMMALCARVDHSVGQDGSARVGRLGLFRGMTIALFQHTAMVVMCAGELLKKAGQKYEVCSARSELKRMSQASQHD